MYRPLQIDFLDIPPSAGLTMAIRKRLGKLEQLCDRLIDCSVTVEAARLQQPGARYAARVRLSVPERELTARREHCGHTPQDSYVAVQNAFDDIQRELETYVRGPGGRSRHSVACALLQVEG